jgi:hypothetical protein
MLCLGIGRGCCQKPNPSIEMPSDCDIQYLLANMGDDDIDDPFTVEEGMRIYQSFTLFTFQMKMCYIHFGFTVNRNPFHNQV